MNHKNIKDISLIEVEYFVGDRIFERGENYFTQGRVGNLYLSPKGVIAQVRGTKEYITFIGVDEKGSLYSRCSCPYGIACKHAVATYFELFSRLKNKKIVEEVSADHKLLLRLERLYDSENFYNDWNSEIFEENISMTKKDVQSKINTFLLDKEKLELIDLLGDLADKYPSVREDIMEQVNLSSGDFKSLTKEIKAEIRAEFEEPSWYDHWKGYGNLADFSRVQSKINLLLDNKQYDSLIEVLWVFIDEADEYIEQSNDEGDAQGQIQECVSIASEALEYASMDNSEKLMMAINAVIDDGFGTFDDLYRYIKKEHDVATWTAVADELKERLDKFSTDDDFITRYKREKISKYVLMAYEKYKTKDEILDFCKEEAVKGGRWLRYINKLKDYKMYEKAEDEAKSALVALKGSDERRQYSDIKEAIAQLALKRGDKSVLLRLKQEKFLDSPGLSTYKDLLKISKQMKILEEMKNWSINYLRTGKAKKKGAMKAAFEKKSSGWRRSFPDFESLIDIAKFEDRIEDIYLLYKEMKKGSPNNFMYQGNKMAEYLADDYPEASIELWKKSIEEIISRRVAKKYKDSIYYFNKIKKAYKKLNQQNKWKDYLVEVRAEYKNLPRFIKDTSKLT